MLINSNKFKQGELPQNSTKCTLAIKVKFDKFPKERVVKKEEKKTAPPTSEEAGPPTDKKKKSLNTSLNNSSQVNILGFDKNIT